MKKFIISTIILFLSTASLSAQELSREERIDRLLKAYENIDVFGLIRFRPEIKDNYDYDRNGTSCTSGVCQSNEDKQEFIGQKIWLGFNYKGDLVRGRVLLQDARVWGGETGSTTGLNTANSNTNQSTDIREAWIDLGSKTFSAQVGRQRMVYGDQRLVGHLDWTSVGRSFDAIRFKHESEYLRSHAWAAVLGEKDSDSAGNNTSSTIQDAYFTGWYNTLKTSDQLHIDLYYLGKHLSWSRDSTPDVNPTVAQARGIIPYITSENRSRDRDNLYTYGIRLTNKTQKRNKAPGLIDWTLEYAYQTGETGRRLAARWDVAEVVVPLESGLHDSTYNPCRVYGTSSVTGTSGCRVYLQKELYDAFAYAGTAGITIMENFRLGVEYAYASGDPDRTDASLATFDNLFHTNHLFYGQGDQISWQNMIGKSINFSANFGSAGKITLAYWHVDKQTEQDAWYKVTGGGQSGSTLETTESRANSKYGSSYNADGSLNSLAVGHLKKHLFREYDLTYVIRVGDVQFGAGYSLMIAGEAVRAVKDDRYIKSQIYGPQVAADLSDGRIDDPATFLKLQDNSFDPRAQFAYLQMSYKF